MRALVYCMENWLGIAHMPRLLKNLGWEVHVSSPPGTHISQTRYKDRFLAQGLRKPDPGPIAQLGMILAESKPDFIIPGDDSSTSLLHVYYELGAKNGAPQWELDVIRRSCGNPEYYEKLEFKRYQMELVDKLGIPAPAWRPASIALDALAFAEEYGYPVVLKADIGTGGSGVKFCYNEDDIVREAKNLQGTWNVCQFAKGKSISSAFAAYDGELLEALVFDRYRDNGGKTTVADIIHKPRFFGHIAKFVKEVGYTGFGSMGFIVDEKDQEYFLEVNSRATPVGMAAILIGIDLPGAITRAFKGERCTPNDGITGRVVLFPQERERNPRMEGLDGIPEFMPPNDPELIRSFWKTVDAPFPPELAGNNLWEKPIASPRAYDSTNPKRVLLFCIDEFWYGAARLPGVFAKAGWEVDVCAPKTSFVAKTRFLNRFLPRASASQSDAYFELSNAIRESQPDFIIAGDDRALKLLHNYYRLAEKQGASAWEIGLLRRSIGSPASFNGLDGKVRQMSVAARAGVQLPAWRSGARVHDALAFSVENGYPVVIKPDFGSAGIGVSICHNEEEIKAAIAKVSGSWFASQFIDGKEFVFAFYAMEGRVVEGFTFYKERVHPPLGPSTVNQVVDAPAVRKMGERYVAEIGYTGFGAVSAIVREDGEAFFLEMNSRVVPMHLVVNALGLNFGEVLMAGAMGQSYKKTLESGTRIALFPQERIRDPRMEGLEGAYEDIPEDDPELLEMFWARVQTPANANR